MYGIGAPSPLSAQLRRRPAAGRWLNCPISVVGRRQREVSQSTEKWPFPISPLKSVREERKFDRAGGLQALQLRGSAGRTAPSGDCLISDADDQHIAVEMGHQAGFTPYARIATIGTAKPSSPP